MAVLAWFWRSPWRSPFGLSRFGAGEMTTAAPMNTHQNYTLASRPQTSRVLRGWAVLSRGTFSGAIFLTDVALIVAMSCLTGIAYYLVAYGEHGHISSFVQVGVAGGEHFRHLQPVPPRIPAAELLQLQAAWPAHDPAVERDADLPADARLPGADQRRLFARLDRAVLRHDARRADRAALSPSCASPRWRARPGYLSAQRIFLIGTGANVGAFINRYEPWKLGINIVGCRFLTPVAAHAHRSRSAARDARPRSRRGRRRACASLEPDAIFVLLPWSATETIERCAETFLSLPVEIHLGPEQVLHKFDEVKLSTLGPVASLQLTRLPLSRLEIIQKRLFDLMLRRGRAASWRRRCSSSSSILIKLDSRGPDLLRAAPLRLQPAAVPHHQVSHHAHARRRRGDPAGARATIRA